MALGALALVAVRRGRGSSSSAAPRRQDPERGPRSVRGSLDAPGTIPAPRRSPPTRGSQRPRAWRSTGAALTGLDVNQERSTSVDEQGDGARATVLMRWDVPAIGAWTYHTRVALQRRDGHWKVPLAPHGGPPAD